MVQVHIQGSPGAAALAQELIRAGVAIRAWPLADSWWAFEVAVSAKRLLPPAGAHGVRYPAGA